MVKRTATALGLFFVGLPALLLGGVLYYILFLVFLGLAAWEYVAIFRAAGYRPARFVVLGSTLVVFTARYFFSEYAAPVFGAIILFVMAFHLWEYEKGWDKAGSDFAISVSGVVYIGWIGSYLGDLRNLPNGGWWVMMVLPIVWMVDTGAYMIGAAYGKHKMSPRLSPKKSWEGFWGGVFAAVAGGAFYAYYFSAHGPLNISIFAGAVLGLLLSVLTPLGDLGESMLKRQAHMKDSGQLLPGHGGILDRIDSWLWAAIIGYYFIIWFGL